jgi:Holliday junction resolvase RusA-like endonuclease
MRIQVDPLGKPRMTQRDKWQKRPAVVSYRAFCDEIRLCYRKDLPSEVKLIFHVPMPRSWSKKKRTEMIGQPHQQKPDIDNMTKAVLDALCKEDSYVWRVDAEKRWAEAGSIEVAAL